MQQRKEEERTVFLAGDLTLPRTQGIRKELLSALDGPKTVLKFGETGIVDLSFLQLLSGALRSALKRGVELAVAGETVPPSVSALVRQAGFAPSPGSGRIGAFWGGLAGRQTGGEGDG